MKDIPISYQKSAPESIGIHPPLDGARGGGQLGEIR
jgi:hypothetical protein